MDDFILARALHVIAVLLWIGGVAFVTLALMPVIRADEVPSARIRAFRAIERRFSAQAKLWVLLAGASGFWMVWRYDMWSRFAEPRLWWMHAMVGLWLLFMLMLFVLEPLVLHRAMNAPDPEARTFARMEWVHRLLLLLALLTVFGAVAGSHGMA
jgi:uncharacterized membrane protein